MILIYPLPTLNPLIDSFSRLSVCSLVIHVCQVFVCLHKYGLSRKHEKYEFYTSILSFVGFVISLEGISMDPDRIATITEWLSPMSVYDIQVFLGFADFYDRFVDGFSHVVSPITILLRKGQWFHWSYQAQSAFDELKHRFTFAPILRQFDPDLPIQLHTDASGFAISGVVSQLHDLHWHPVAFYSHKCTSAECNYHIHDRELLAVIESMQYWCYYLEGSYNPVQVLCDHETLKIFISTKALSCCHMHWAELLMNYDFVFVSISGTKNPAHGSSHCPDYSRDVSILTGSLIPPNALCLFFFNFTNLGTNALFACIIRVHAVDAPETSIRERIISSFLTDAVASEHLTNLQPP